MTALIRILLFTIGLALVWVSTGAGDVMRLAAPENRLQAQILVAGGFFPMLCFGVWMVWASIFGEYER